VQTDAYTKAVSLIFSFEIRGIKVLAERVGFEPTVRENRTPDFESGTFDHSATSPTQVRNVSRKQWFRYTSKKLIK
jgi:hypothetical protein